MQLRHILVTSETGSQNNYWMIFNDGEIVNPKLVLNESEMIQLVKQYEKIKENLKTEND